MDFFPLNDLPEEILEKLFSFTSPYKDYYNISLVCKKWNRIINGLKELDKKAFNDCFINNTIRWKAYQASFAPTQRHSHASCRIKDYLYVFGGLSATNTSYNDLWKLDLNTKTWTRPITSGSSYPSPKACASLVAYKSSLILYGGYSHPYLYSVHQQVNFFDELHIYCTKTCTWRVKILPDESPKLAGHTASILNDDKMIIFGGCNGSLNNKINDIYGLCLTRLEWLKIEIIGKKPESRYGHSQITIDNEHILIIGGCGGPNNLYDDCWYLTIPKISTNNGYWQKLIIKQTFNAPIQLHCISLVRCDNKLVTFGRPKLQICDNNNNNTHNGGCSNTATATAGLSSNRRICTCSTKSTTVINGYRNNEKTTTSSGAANSKVLTTTRNVATNKILNKSERNTVKRLEVLENIACRYKQNNRLNNDLLLISRKNLNQCIVHSKLMQVFVLDIENLMSNNKQYDDDQSLLEITWLEPIANFKSAPPNTILYSLNEGLNEIIMFGGMEIDSNNLQYNSNNNSNQQQQDIVDDDIVRHKVCNGLYIMKANSLI